MLETNLVMFVLSGAYIMYALLFIIIPGCEDKDDYILGALRLYLMIGRVLFLLMVILCSSSKKKANQAELPPKSSNSSESSESES